MTLGQARQSERSKLIVGLLLDESDSLLTKETLATRVQHMLDNAQHLLGGDVGLLDEAEGKEF